MIYEKFLSIYYTKEFQIAVDICRVLLIIIALVILYVLFSNIESVKLLMNDPCQVCMNKTGATCFSYP